MGGVGTRCGAGGVSVPGWAQGYVRGRLRLSPPGSRPPPQRTSRGGGGATAGQQRPRAAAAGRDRHRDEDNGGIGTGQQQPGPGRGSGDGASGHSPTPTPPRLPCPAHPDPAALPRVPPSRCHRRRAPDRPTVPGLRVVAGSRWSPRAAPGSHRDTVRTQVGGGGGRGAPSPAPRRDGALLPPCTAPRSSPVYPSSSQSAPQRTSPRLPTGAPSRGQPVRERERARPPR